MLVVVLFGTLLIAGTTAGLAQDDGDETPQTETADGTVQVRFVRAVPNASTADVAIDGETLLDNATASTASAVGYLDPATASGDDPFDVAAESDQFTESTVENETGVTPDNQVETADETPAADEAAERGAYSSGPTGGRVRIVPFPSLEPDTRPGNLA